MCFCSVLVTNTAQFRYGGSVHALRGDRTDKGGVHVRATESLQFVKCVGIDENRFQRRHVPHLQRLAIPERLLSKADGRQGRQRRKQQIRPLSLVVRKRIRQEDDAFQTRTAYSVSDAHETDIESPRRNNRRKNNYRNREKSERAYLRITPTNNHCLRNGAICTSRSSATVLRRASQTDNSPGKATLE